MSFQPILSHQIPAPGRLRRQQSSSIPFKDMITFNVYLDLSFSSSQVHNHTALFISNHPFLNSLIQLTVLYNLSHYLDTAELSPLLDMHGAVHAWATYTFILNSESTVTDAVGLLSNFWKQKKVNFSLVSLFNFVTTTYGLYLYSRFHFVRSNVRPTSNLHVYSEDGCSHALLQEDAHVFNKP